MSDLAHDPDAVARDGAPVVLLKAGLKVAVPLAALIVVGSYVVRGVAGGTTALVAAVVLLALHAGTAAAAAWAGRISPHALQAVTTFGFLLRLALYGLLIALLSDVRGIDGPVLAATVLPLTIAMLAAEARVVARYSKFWWTPTEAPAAAGATRKDPA